MSRSTVALCAGLLAGALLSGTGTARTVTALAGAGTRLTIEVPPASAAQAPAQSPATTPGPVPEVPPFTTPRSALQAMVIDPGHGGEDSGVTGAGDVAERQLTLDIARRAKVLIETRLGIRVLLTRDDDRAVGPDERAATANNSKSDLFLSLHFNAAFDAQTTGAEVYSLALDREGQEALKASQADSIPLSLAGGGARPIDLIRWDLAQVRHIDASMTLAGLLAEALRARVPMGSRPLQQAPIRVLAGVNMPAALIELAYLTNPDQAERAASVEFQSSIAQALYDAVLRFRDYLEARR